MDTLPKDSAIAVMPSFQSEMHQLVHSHPLLPSQITTLGHLIITKDSRASPASSIPPSPTSPSYPSVSTLQHYLLTEKPLTNGKVEY